ncbi:MAG: lipoprotein-releasing ABC transporter ATP-binding protein LolD [Proteobacteria bacterium]|nr:lipoprotein-releasing ABC transporter ATP-binding protein LolD [Pseudomonadota bacterium]
MNDQLTDQVISCVGLYKSFAEGDLRVDVLRGVNLQVTRGESIAIMGTSGSGKSTLLHLLGGLDLPSKGETKIIGKNTSTLTDAERGKLRNESLGFIYQFHHLLPEFTALENVAMPLLISDNCDANQAANSAKEILEKVGLGDRLEHKPGELSGGERQRAAIARALVTRPECILADEPTGNLDEKTADQVFNLMLELKQAAGTSLIMVTHNLSLAEKMDKTYQLHDGLLEAH